MRFLDKKIGDTNKAILEVSIYDEEDIATIKNNYVEYENIEISLGMLHFLKYFSVVKTLIITGGMVDKYGLECLYEHKELEMLVLDYEETDSDEDGIDITKFPKMKYVLSRSNLNIRKNAVERAKDVGISVEILNYYKKGKPIKIIANPTTIICRETNFLFFSTESKEPASVIIMRMLNKLTSEFQKEFSEKIFSKKLESISIIPICMPKDMLEQGFGKERKYVSIKRKYADIRLQIPYEDFLKENRREEFIKENIQKAIEYVARKDDTFELEKFLKSLETVYKNCNF